MNERGKSDGPIVPQTPANNGGAARLDGSHPAASPAEQVEGIQYCVPYAVTRRRSSVGVSPTRQLSLQPVATGAAVAVTKSLESSV